MWQGRVVVAREYNDDGPSSEHFDDANCRIHKSVLYRRTQYSNENEMTRYNRIIPEVLKMPIAH